MVLGSLCLLSEVQPVENSPDLARRSRLALVIARLGTSITDVILKVPFTNEFLDLIFEHNALLGGVAEIFVMPAILVLIPF